MNKRDAKLITVALLLPACGCLQGLSAFPRELGVAADAMVNMVRDQGVLDDFTQELAGNVQDPGLETYGQFTVTSGVRIVGVNGQVDLRSRGSGTQLPAGLRTALLEMLEAPISDEQRAAILTIFGWNRQESPHNPPPG